MTLTINKSIDFEDEVRKAIKGFVTCYCDPLPAILALPSVEVRKIGGNDTNTIDTAMVMLYCRAEDEATASDTLREAVGVLKEVCRQQTTALRYATVNTGGAWGSDPVRPDLAMCSVTMMVYAHQNKTEVESNEQ